MKIYFPSSSINQHRPIQLVLERKCHIVTVLGRAFHCSFLIYWELILYCSNIWKPSHLFTGVQWGLLSWRDDTKCYSHSSGTPVYSSLQRLHVLDWLIIPPPPNNLDTILPQNPLYWLGKVTYDYEKRPPQRHKILNLPGASLKENGLLGFQEARKIRENTLHGARWYLYLPVLLDTFWCIQGKECHGGKKEREAHLKAQERGLLWFR